MIKSIMETIVGFLLIVHTFLFILYLTIKRLGGVIHRVFEALPDAVRLFNSSIAESLDRAFHGEEEITTLDDGFEEEETEENDSPTLMGPGMILTIEKQQ